MVLKDLLNQTAIYFPFEGIDRHGNASFGDAEEVSCRWKEDITNIVGADGEEYSTTLQVLISVEVVEGSVLIPNGVLGVAVVDLRKVIRSVSTIETISKDEQLWQARL